MKFLALPKPWMPLSLHALFRDAKRTSAGSTIISGKSSVKIVIYDDFLELYGIFLLPFYQLWNLLRY